MTTHTIRSRQAMGMTASVLLLHWLVPPDEFRAGLISALFFMAEQLILSLPAVRPYTIYVVFVAAVAMLVGVVYLLAVG